MPETKTRLVHTVENPENNDMRIDLYVSHVLGICSRSQVDHYNLTVEKNGQPVKLSRRVKEGDILQVEYSKPESPAIVPEKIPLKIIYEDARVIVVNKPQGMVVHPAKGNYSGTLIQGLLFYCSTLRSNFDEEEERPGIVHRLDKDTSGVIVTAKNVQVQEYLSSQFRNRKVKKRYLAIVKGRPPLQKGLIEKHILRDRLHRKRFTVTQTGGKRAVTGYRIVRQFREYTLVALFPRTGRTHQLRVHMSWLHCPILGDPIYARRDKNFPNATLMLHAYSLSIGLPGEEEFRTFKAPVPKRFKDVTEILDRELFPDENR